MGGLKKGGPCKRLNLFSLSIKSEDLVDATSVFGVKTEAEFYYGFEQRDR
jgi:hypothetical protein